MEHYCHNKECKFYKDKYRPHSILIDGIYPNERRIQRHRWKKKYYLCDDCSEVVTEATGFSPIPLNNVWEEIE